MKIVVDDKIPFLKGVLEPYAEVIYLPGKDINREILKDTDALLVRTRTKCTGNLLAGTMVRFIGTATIGFDHIDTKYCNNNQIFWTNAPGCNSSSVQQYIASALLKISGRNNFMLKDKTLGIIGVGNVGSKVAGFAQAIGMKVLLNDPPRARKEGGENFCSLDFVLSESDIITVHVPLNPEGEDRTFHLFDDETFNKVKKEVWFFNSSRGEVADTLSLKKIIQSGRLAGAVIDVWENEPAIDRELMQQAYISTPHIAGYSTDGKANGTAMVVNSLSRYFELPLEDWYPENVPPPAHPILSIECSGKSDEEIIREAVFHSYDIDTDNTRLRQSPSDFEKIRGDYPLRREFTSYSVDLKNGSESVKKLISNLGFRIVV
jgi:erythronate-4-phosphate dehydrogenase